MQVNIQIDCQTIQELSHHLMKLNRQIFKEASRLNLSINKDELPEHIDLNLNSTYSRHKVNVIPNNLPF